MWIRTQCKKQLINVIRISFQRNIASKNKAVLIGQFANSSFFQSNQIVVGEYRTKEEALAELSAIEEAISKGEKGVYSVK